jgi:hypothetical protein
MVIIGGIGEVVDFRRCRIAHSEPAPLFATSLEFRLQAVRVQNA